jgi:hypothetical protein
MVDDILFHALLLVVLLWLCLTWYWMGAWNRLAPYPGATQARQADQDTRPRDEALFGGHRKAPLRGMRARA